MLRGTQLWGLVPLLYFITVESVLGANFSYYYDYQYQAYNAYKSKLEGLTCPGDHHSPPQYTYYRVEREMYGTIGCPGSGSTKWYYYYTNPAVLYNEQGEPLPDPEECTDDITIQCIDSLTSTIRPPAPVECTQTGYYCNWDSNNPDQWSIYPICNDNSNSACYNIDTALIDYPGGSINPDNSNSVVNPNDPSTITISMVPKSVDDSSFPWNTPEYISNHPELSSAQSRKDGYCLTNTSSSFCSEYNLANDSPSYCTNNPSSNACRSEFPNYSQPTTNPNQNDSLGNSNFGSGSGSGTGGGSGDISTNQPSIDPVVEQSQQTGSTDTTTEQLDYSNWFSRMSSQLENIKNYIKSINDYFTTDLGDLSQHEQLFQDRVFSNQDDYKTFIENLSDDSEIVGGAPTKIDQLIQSFVPSGSCAELTVEQSGATTNILSDFCDKWDNGGGRSALGFLFYVFTAVAIFGVWSSASKN